VEEKNSIKEGGDLLILAFNQNVLKNKEKLKHLGFTDKILHNC
jgi:hypothetical protein